VAIAGWYWVGYLRGRIDVRAIEAVRLGIRNRHGMQRASRVVLMEVPRDLLMALLRRSCVIAMLIAVAIFSGGCASSLVTNPPRSATEQLLLSSAADRAMASVNLDIFAGRTVYLDLTYFDSYDSKYAEGEVRDALFRAGALLVNCATNADVIIEARSGALAIDNDTILFGVPNMSVPIPLSVPIEIPEIALYKNQTQHSYAKFALLAYVNKSRAHIYSSGPLDGKAYHDYHKVLFISWVATDIPEKEKTQKKAEKCKIWSPQYDLQNMPPPASGSGAPLRNPALINVPATTVSTTAGQ
jgi:hypothetical protein